MNNPTVFSSATEQAASVPSPEKEQNSKKTLISARKTLKSAKKLLQELSSLLQENVLPQSVTEAEKAVLSESNTMLRESAVHLWEMLKSAGESPEEQKKKVDAARANVHQEYQKAVGQLEHALSERLSPLEEEQRNIEAELHKLREEYKAKSSVLLQRKKELTQQTKEIRTEKKQKKSIANAARKKALEKAQHIAETELSADDLAKTEMVTESVKTNILRAKGALQTALPNGIPVLQKPVSPSTP
ncbi:hypothetical protein IPN35_00765 [Candidatus Peregrinibacteria bacterium]|nr:MAG: hypothetical protein IPN35_00765 [Candidatus Peregrinibacteria bacterium]